MKALIALFTGLHLLAAGANAAPASASAVSPGHSRCAAMSHHFTPRIVPPGQGIEYQFQLENCGTVTEQLTVQLAPAGPCRFMRPSTTEYVLDPGEGFAVFALMIAPTCPGSYHVEGRVTLGSRTLDHGVAFFRVRNRTSDMAIRSVEPT